jgi:ankyrin repeat protein
MHKQIVLGIVLFASLLVGTACGQSLNEQLFTAVGDGNLREVQSLLSRGANASVTYGELPDNFHLKNGDFAMVFITPFAYSLQKKNQEISLLLAHTVKLAISWNHIDDSGKDTVHSLSAAVIYDNVEVTEILLQRGASIGDADEQEGLFADVKSVAMADLLLSHGAQVNARNAEGEVALDSSYILGVTMAEWLVAHGADVNIKDNKGRTPLHRAALYSEPKMVELLLKHGAAVNAKDNDGATPLHMLGSKDKLTTAYNVEVVELLMSHGADIDAKDKAGQTPLSRVRATANQNLIQALQAHGGTINIGSRELLEQSVAQFKGHAYNETLRSSIIDLALKMKPAPAIPAEAEAAAGRGTYIFKNAKSPEEVLSAAKEYLSAIEAAPWVANYYFNLCTVLEKTPYSQQALHACKLYLVAAPDATDAGAVRQRIAGLQYAYDRDKAQMKQRTRYIKPVGLEDMYRFGGISGTVSGRDIALKLFVDWGAAPPKYQVYAGCFGGDEIYGVAHDLVSTDNWSSFCKPVVNVHLVIKPEGEGFVEVSDSNGGSLRATLNELFEAKQKTMAQAVMFSANGDQGDQFYVPYAQGGVDLKHAGWAMYESDCNGSILKKDPRALPDSFIPGDKFKAGDYGRFHAELDFYGGPKAEVCTNQFFSKTRYHFGEAE